LDILLTDQLIGTIDLRYRAMINYEVNCQVIKDESLINDDNPKGIVGFVYTIFHCERGMYKYMIAKFMMTFEFAKTIFPFYNTNQIISSINDSMMLSITQDKTTILETVDKIIDELFEKYPPRLITKGIVSNYCLENNRPKDYVDVIYNRLKSRILEYDKKKKLE
jgi:hypothetical protein